MVLVEEDLGHEVAVEVAQRLVMFLKRPGTQAQFSRTLVVQAADRSGSFASLHAWMADNLDQDLSVATLADQAGMSPRHFARTYAARTGVTPPRRSRLCGSKPPVRCWRADPSCRSLAWRGGFLDDERMRRSFLRATGVAPAEYRQRFGLPDRRDPIGSAKNEVTKEA